MMFRTRTDYGASFELRGIPATRRVGAYSLQLLTAPTNFSDAAWLGASVTRAPDTTFPLSDLSGAVPTMKLTSTVTAANSLIQVKTVSFPRVRYRVVAHKFTGATTANRFAIFDATASADVMGVSINYDTGVLTSVQAGVNERFYTNSLGGGWWEINLETDITSAHSFNFYVGFVGAAVTTGDALVAASAQVLPIGSTRNVDFADRLVAHLLGGGTCAVTTDDKDDSTYATCALMPGTEPSLTLADPRLMEYTLSLQLINVAASPVQMVCRYV
jgi:hypothetical protein